MQDDALLAALLSSPSLALVGATLDGRIVRWSEGASLLYGWTEDEIVGQPLSVLLPEERRAQDLGERDRLASGGAVGPAFVTLRVAKDGTRIPVDLHLSVARDADGEPVGYVSLHRDLRRTQRAEAALLASGEELRAAFPDSPVPQSRVDLQGRVLAVNLAMEKLLGEPAADLVGRNALEMYVETDRPALEQSLAALASGAQNHVQQERTLALSDGRHVPVVVTMTALTDASGATVLAVSVEDVSALKAAQEHVRIQAERLEALLVTMPVAAFSYDARGRCTWSEGRALATLGLADGEAVGRDLLDDYDAASPVGAALRASLRGREARALFDAGHAVFECHYQPRRDHEGNVAGGLGIVVDVTQLAAAEREVRVNEARMRALLRNAADVVLVVDRQGRLLWVSPAVDKVLGWEPTSLFWRPLRELVHPDDAAAVAQAWERVLRGEPEGRAGACRLQRADGALRWFDYGFTDLLDDPAVGGVVVNLRDVTEQQAAEHELRRLAVHDPVTGLANRLLLLDRVGQALAWGRQNSTQTGLILLGVTGMTRINETLGHDGGDELLRTVGERLVGAVRGIDSVARVGGDTFGVLIEDVGSEEELRARATTLAEAISLPFSHGGVEVEVRVRVGSAMSPAADAGVLLSAAERSLAASDAAAPRLVVARVSDRQERGGADQAVDELRRAVARGELRLHFQPIMNVLTGDVDGAEALVRWQHPQRGLLSPVEFVPLAESSGLIAEVGEWVLREACARAAQWQDEGRPFGVGVNLSPHQMVGTQFADLVRRVLRETGAEPDRLVLEVTESAVMDSADAVDVLQELRALGVKLALDDFGTGYSSLTYLRRFPIDAIKIDRSFVAGLGRDADDDAIVASVVSLGRAIGKLLVAEGVETPAQLGALRTMGVQQAQGFLWSPGLPPEELTRWLDDHERRPVPAAVPRPNHAEEVREPSGRAVERILQLHREGASLHTIAAALNAEGLRTAAGPRWTTTTVARVVAGRARPA